LDEAFYGQLMRAGLVEAAAPVVTEYVSSPQLGGSLVQLLGIDPFAEAPFRSYLGGEGELMVSQLVDFLTRPAAVLISSEVAARYGLEACAAPAKVGPGDCDITFEVAGELRPATVVGLLRPGGGSVGRPATAESGRPATAETGGPAGPEDGRTDTTGGGAIRKPAAAEGAPGGLSARALEGLVLADIATAQEMTGRLGRLDRIDLILPACVARSGDRPEQVVGDRPGKGIENGQGCAAIERIRALLPPGAQLQPVEARTGTVEEMTAAFRLNLAALSLLALVVGMFLIYNTMTFSVVQRRPLFGTLRCLGVTRREVFVLVSVEALAVGALGAALGAGLGVLLGQGAVRMVTQTINDLYFVVTVRGVQIPASSLAKGALLGVVATLLTAAPPAWEAASVPPRAALERAGLERKAQRAVAWAALGGALLLASGAGLLLLPSGDLVVSFLGTFAVIVGFAALAPLVTRLLMDLAAPLLGRAWGILGRMAPRDVVNALSRTSVAVAALMVAVSVTIGVSLMVNSFRHTVIAWLDQTLQGDIYISAPTLTATQSSAPLDPRVVAAVQSWPGIERVDVLRSAEVDSPYGPVHVAAANNPTLGEERVFLAAAGTPAEIDAALENGAVLVSEPFANRIGLLEGFVVGASAPKSALKRALQTDSALERALQTGITLQTASGAQQFPVAGIYYDYTSSQGTVLMSLETYRRAWRDETLTAMAARLRPGEDADGIARALGEALAPVQRLVVRPNRELRADVLEVFDRTFAITGALQLLATLVAFIGVLSALLSLQLERQRELGILRAVGLTARELWGLVMVETGLMGSVSGLLAMPTGFILALILIYIINRRSFGWTLQMQVEAGPFVQALVVAVAAALLAGIYPAWRMGRMAAAEALRSE
jgi:putative ABC transport system permease protein